MTNENVSAESIKIVGSFTAAFANAVQTRSTAIISNSYFTVFEPNDEQTAAIYSLNEIDKLKGCLTSAPLGQTELI